MFTSKDFKWKLKNNLNFPSLITSTSISYKSARKILILKTQIIPRGTRVNSALFECQ